MDPLKDEFPWNSPYAFAENDVVRSIDLEGLERAIVINRYNGGRLTTTRIQRIQAGNDLVNLNATGTDAAGNNIGGLPITSILEMNVGNHPANVNPTNVNPANVRSNYTPAEQRILAAGVDNKRTLIACPPLGARGNNNSDRMGDIGG